MKHSPYSMFLLSFFIRGTRTIQWIQFSEEITCVLNYYILSSVERRITLNCKYLTRVLWKFQVPGVEFSILINEYYKVFSLFCVYFFYIPPLHPFWLCSLVNGNLLSRKVISEFINLLLNNLCWRFGVVVII